MISRRLLTHCTRCHHQAMMKDTPLKIHPNQLNRHFSTKHLTNNVQTAGQIAPVSLSHRKLSFWGSTKPASWTKAVSDAEKIVGYPTSFMSLRCLLSDELSNVALHMRKLVGTRHPLLKTARKFLYDGKHSLQTRGLLVLLVSKAVSGIPTDYPNERLTEQMVSGIYPSQRSLAEITEMIHTASLIHTGVVNLKELAKEDNSKDDMEFGNKMAVLSGDFLLANASTGLASLQNTKVVELMSAAIGDIMEGEFSIQRDSSGYPVLPHGGITVEEWLELTHKATASLIATSCQCAVMLAQHSPQLQQQAYEFGRNMAIAHQLHDDLLPFTHPLEENNGVNVLSAPVVLHINHHKDQEEVQKLIQAQQASSNTLLKLVEKSDAISEAKKLRQHYGEKAIVALNHFPSSDAHDALRNIVQAVTAL